MALYEQDLPYVLRIACGGLVETLGRVTFGGKVGPTFTAHPKSDPATGELFYFGTNLQKKSYCWYGWLDAGGGVVRNMPIALPKPVLMHDFAITEHYVLLLDMPLEFSLKHMIKHRASPFVFANRPARIGVLPRYAQSGKEIKWFTLDRFMCLHTANAWEEGSTIRLFLCAMRDFNMEKFADSEPVLTEVTLDMQTGATSVCPLCDSPEARGDFPVVHPARIGRPSRYVYVASLQPDKRRIPMFVGIVKFDLQAGPGESSIAGRILHGGARLGGEAVFVPKRRWSGDVVEGPEDDGYLMTYVTDEDTLQSELVIYDAASMSSAPIARLGMPQRVPHGFHGAWLSAEQLAAQGSGGSMLPAGGKRRAAPAACELKSSSPCTRLPVTVTRVRSQ